MWKKYIFYAILIAIALFFAGRLFLVNHKIGKEEFNFERYVKDTINTKYQWHVIPQRGSAHVVNGIISFYIAGARLQNRNGTQNVAFYYYPVENALDVLATSKIQKKVHIVYLTSQEWVCADNENSKIHKSKLPVQTQSAAIINDSVLLIRLFDFKDKKNYIKIIDTFGNVLYSFKEVYPVNDDGGLSVAATLLADSNYIYSISQYTNNVYRISKKDGRVKHFTTIEKIAQYPKTIKHRNSYSFKENPYMVHPNAKLVDGKFYILSAIRDNAYLKNNTKLVYIDVYDTEFRYLHSLVVKDVSYNDLTDYLIFGNDISLVRGYEYMTTIIYNEDEELL
ncbi:hypothetical protein ACFSPU_10120 [Haoranjiania flava]|uniref:Uncharacterized protein n=1 Tax=Haoranjiania flava TaxID=1856322 RepID=A0AAE3LJB4_9BACT|nr:hypothetical protein [Haoranjiania flava]MCU7693448.1 hypothetical protein [Haoranjiania flava]